MISYVLPLQAKSMVNLGTGVRKLRGILGKVSEKHPHLLTFSPPTDYAWPNNNIFFASFPDPQCPARAVILYSCTEHHYFFPLVLEHLSISGAERI